MTESFRESVPGLRPSLPQVPLEAVCTGRSRRAVWLTRIFHDRSARRPSGMFIASPRSRFIFCQFGKRFAIRNQVRKSLIIAVLQVPGTTWHSVSGPKARSFWLIPIHTRSAGRFGLFAHCLQMLRYGTRTPATKGIAPGTVIFYLITSSLADQLGYDVHL